MQTYRYSYQRFDLVGIKRLPRYLQLLRLIQKIKVHFGDRLAGINIKQLWLLPPEDE